MKRLSFIALGISPVLFGPLLLLPGCCFLRIPLRQDIRPLTYWRNTGVLAAWETQFVSAHKRWNTVFNLFTFGGQTTRDLDPTDGVNVIAMTTFTKDPTTLAEVFPRRFVLPCRVSDTDMGINRNMPWSTSGATDAFDLETTIVHEFGHYGVLFHVICPKTSVMVAEQRLGEIKRDLTICDALGMWVANVIPECLPATGICFPSFFAQAAFDDTDDEDQPSVDPMQKNADELIQIWNGSATLRANADSVGDLYARILDNWRKGGTAGSSVFFTTERYQEIDSKIISVIYAGASTPLRADLDNLRSHLQGKIGLTLQEIYGGDMQIYSSFSGGDGGRVCDTCKSTQ